MNKVEIFLLLLALANFFYIGLKYGEFRARNKIIENIFKHDKELDVDDDMIIDEYDEDDYEDVMEVIVGTDTSSKKDMKN